MADRVLGERRTVAWQRSEADWIKECTAKISNAIGGGSELFVRHGDGFRLDVDFVCKRIVEMRERHHEAKLTCVLAARQAEALQRENAEKDELQKIVNAVLTWAEQRCPCHNDQPNPCPLCGASVENLEPCKSAENTIPRHLLADLRRASALTQGKTP
ncbi:hypothetical protein B5M44_04415 [Shinella sumterensis]|uniref:hypothetical protein n=1 Tax=Shinella sumterensis TaxID=1967501 RepID=UPI00106E06FD|nr:hypothetical protein [Shinella sumterensis]MCD1264012.1 hypothetical protein [Shinella sumterensis]TFE99447.1 hypothetical protein B5M44_04415 [Shinella sumterensis]